MYKVYILFSKARNRYYIGFTGDDMGSRLRKHNSNHGGFTGSANDWELLWQEEHDSQTEARARESEIKKWKRRKRIETLIISK